jgi:hypothetical protein
VGRPPKPVRTFQKSVGTISALYTTVSTPAILAYRRRPHGLSSLYPA